MKTILTIYDHDGRAVVLYYSLYGLCGNSTKAGTIEQTGNVNVLFLGTFL